MVLTSKQLRIDRGQQHHGLGFVSISQAAPKGWCSLIPQRNVYGHSPVVQTTRICYWGSYTSIQTCYTTWDHYKKFETTHGSISKRTTIRVVAVSFWRSDPWTERISPTTSARGKLFITYYNDGNIYMQWERDETWKLKISVSKHLKMINTPDQELVGPDHRSVSQDFNNTRWRYEADHELMFGDLVHVRDSSNFKTIQSHNRTGFQTRPELAGSVSGDETMNHRVL